MKKIDSTVLAETTRLSALVIIMSAILQAVFLIIGKWDVTVLLGNLLSVLASILNFFLMGLSVQRSVELGEGEAKKIMTVSHTLRSFFMFLVLVCGVIFPIFNTWTVIIPMFFPRIAVALRPIADKNGTSQQEGGEREK